MPAPDDEHIEDLLSQLQGIFGRLSTSEEEESKGKLDVQAAPLAAPAPAPEPEPRAPVPDPTVVPEPPATTDPLPPLAPAEPAQEVVPVGAPEPPAPAADAASNAPPAPMIVTGSAIPFETSVPESSEATLLQTAVFFPAGREAEARTLAQKLEMITPKFTKISFRLRVHFLQPYDPKSEWKDLLVDQASTGTLHTLFIIVDRALDETRRKPLAAELESKKVYFQDVQAASIEKKAFYTDLLLGLIFFFDTIKPPSPE